MQEAGLKVPNRELWTGVGGPAGEMGKSGRQGLHFQAKEPQGHHALCLFSGFVFVFVFRREVVSCISTHYPENILATKGVLVGCCPTPLPPITAYNLVQSSKSHGKWQWLGWTVAGESLGLGTQVPSIRLQLGSSTGGRFCSLAASTGSDQIQQGGTAGISYCPSLRVSSTLGTSCRLPRKSSSQVWPSTSSRRLAVDAAAPSD